MMGNPFSSAYERALSAGFLPFYPSKDLSNPSNSGPYLLGFNEFSRDFAKSEKRSELLESLDKTVLELRDLGCAVDTLIVGGSFLDMNNDRPKDLDCCAVFRVVNPDLFIETELALIQRKAVSDGLDLRLVPGDGKMSMTIKLVGYFILLYSSERGRYQMTRSAIVIDMGDSFS